MTTANGPHLVQCFPCPVKYIATPVCERKVLTDGYTVATNKRLPALVPVPAQPKRALLALLKARATLYSPAEVQHWHRQTAHPAGTCRRPLVPLLAVATRSLDSHWVL